VPEASELQVVLTVTEQLRDELGAATTEEEGPHAGHDRREPWGPTDVEHGRLVARLSSSLAQIAAAAASPTWEDRDDESTARVAAALARTELVIRGELTRGDEAALREQLPGFVFLVVLPSAGMDRALDLASRAKALLDQVRE
jgi:hypothetical protein